MEKDLESTTDFVAAEETEAAEEPVVQNSNEATFDYENKEEKDTDTTSDDEKDEDKSDKKDEDKSDNKEKFTLEYINELQANYNTLESNFNNLKYQYETLQAQLQELTKFKTDIDNQKKDELISEFYMLSAEDKADIIQNKEKYTYDEIKAKLSVICFDKKINFALDSNKTKDENFTICTLVEDFNDNLPEWVKEVKEQEKLNY